MAASDARDQLGELVARALDGDRAAWNTIVERLQLVVWKTVNMMTFEPDVRDDAFAATWLRLAERLATIREPEKLPGWLATTAANEVRQIRRRRGRVRVGLDAEVLERAAAGVSGDSTGADDPADRAVTVDEHRRVRNAYARLDEPCQNLLAVLVMSGEPIGYETAAATLQRPVGALGPSRRRCLDKMRTLLTSEEASP